MITRITGKIVGKNPLEIQTSGGVTYEVIANDRTLSRLNLDETAEILVYHHIREDLQQLFGFASKEEKAYFNALIKVSGIGPKTATAILSMYDTDQLKEIFANRDFSSIAKVPGVGKKSAQKIILELSGKLDEGEFGLVMEGNDFGDKEVIKELKMALKNLGYTGEELDKKTKGGCEILKSEPDIKIEDLLTKILNTK